MRKKKKKYTPLQELRIRVSIAKKAGYFKQPRIKKLLKQIRKKKRR